MAQLGFHGLIGVGLARLVAPGETQEGSVRAESSPKGGVGSRDEKAPFADPARNLRWGLVVGSILPDTDFFLLGPLYLIDAQLGLAMHRTFTHSLLVAAAVLGYFRLRSGGGRDHALWSLGVGIAAGLAAHALTDLIVWFSGVDLLWPLGLLGLPSWVNFWAGHVNPPIVPKLLGAADYLAFALFYLYVRNRAQALGTDLDFVPRVNRYLRLSVLLWVLYTVLALTSISASLFDIAHYAVFIVAFLPMILQTTWRMRTTLSAPWQAATPAATAAPTAGRR